MEHRDLPVTCHRGANVVQVVLVDLVRTLVVISIGTLLTALFSAAAAIAGRIDPSSPVVQRIVVGWARSCLRATGADLHVIGRDRVDPSRSYVVVANHLSNLDVVVCFLAIPLPIRFLAKKELFRVPILSQAMRSIGIIEVERGGRSGVIQAVNAQSEAVIARGHSLIIFPEGTRSRDGELQPFKKGAFVMAANSGMPLLPVTIVGTRDIWPPSGLIRRGGRVDVYIDHPIETSGVPRNEIEALRRRTQTQIAVRYETPRLPIGPSWE